ncbi:MAG: rRNA pseudouridine synthase [Patescibacteria group bacterium]|nr:rRNA pseudouridine synthase [Patescibacteria group bacterium]
MMEIDAKYPIRINRYLSLKNYATRKGADELIKQGLVTINGKIAVLGDKVQENDKVEVNEELRNEIKHRTYLAYNKPAGIVTSLPQGNEKSIEDVTHFPKKVFPIGRLDKDSHGLIILTDDGRITDKLLNPKYIHEKEYVVQVHKEMTPKFLKKMETGVKLDDNYITKPCEVYRMTKNKFRIIITEGKKRQIRRMCLAQGYEVMDLCRIRIMNIQLSDIGEGESRKIKGKMLEVFLEGLGMI